MAEDLILWSQEGAVVTLTFNRPDKLNALNPPMWDALDGALERVAADPSARGLDPHRSGPGLHCRGGCQPVSGL